MATLAAQIWRHASGRGLLLLGTALMCTLQVWCRGALALNPELDVSQYAHTAWKVRDGFSKGLIGSIAQTPDGYLWLGTQLGLYRFDGVRNVPWQPPEGQSLAGNWIRSLLAARDGTLWIGTLEGLASWKGGKLTLHPELAGQSVEALLEDREGTVWAGAQIPPSAGGRLCAIRNGGTQCFGEDGSLGRWVASLHQDSKGQLWVAASDALWRWKPGPPKRHPLPATGTGYYQSLAEGDDGALLIATRGGITRLVDGKVDPFPTPDIRMQAQPRMLRDRNGGLWIGICGQGLVHVHQGRTDVFGRSDGLSGDCVDRLFEDREGNIWVATMDGLDRFREFAAATYTVNQGLPTAGIASVLAATDGSVWLSTRAGLNRWNDGQITAYRERGERSTRGVPSRAMQQPAVREIVGSGLPDGEASLFQDARGRIWIGTMREIGYLENERFISVNGVPGGVVDAITEDGRGDLWIAHHGLGLFRLSPSHEVVERIPWNRLGRNDPAYRLAADLSQGGLWLGYLLGGVAHFVDGRIDASYGTADGLGKGRVNQVRVDQDGALWAATEGGLSRLKNGRVATLTGKSGLPCDAVHWMIEGDADSVWLYMACGIVRMARSELDAWAAAADRGTDANQAIRATVFDSSDGVRSVAAISSYSPHVAQSGDGKLWFAAPDGVSVIDPRRLPYNALPPPVHVEQIVADRKAYEASSQVRLPPLVRDLQIDYTALSFVAPEKNRFRYKLEGRDRDWQDAGNRRQAFYTDLDPGNYRFRVIASNNSGVWNEQGVSLDFSVAPAYWQTNWFRAFCVFAAVVILFLLYRRRVRQLARQFSLTLEARVAERTRIARELHDTLLQSFHGLLLRFQTVLEVLPDRPAEARQLLVSAIDQAAEAITEGRDAVQGLRASAPESIDLAAEIRALGEEFRAERGGDEILRVEVQGTPRRLHPMQRDEIFRIAGEALRNAFQHAEAKQIEVELRYDERNLRLRVRDDGKGIDATVLRQGAREGHFGMRGMRERATLVGGKLTVWSAPDSGTEVELNVPSSHAYMASSSASGFESADGLHDERTS